LQGKLLEIKGEAVAIEEMGQETSGRSYSLLLGKMMQKCRSALPLWEITTSTTLTCSCRSQQFCQISLLELGKFLSPYLPTSLPLLHPETPGNAQAGQGICDAKRPELKAGRKEPDPAA